MKKVSLVIGAEIEVDVADDIAHRLKTAGLTGERDATKFATESTPLARVINELKAHGASDVWVKKVAVLEKD